MVALITSIVVFAFVPLLYRLAQKYTRAHKIINGLILAVIVGVVVGHILPESIHVVGWKAIIVAAIGMAVPSIFERMWHKLAVSVHWVPLLFGVTGLALHAAMDGAAMLEMGEHAGHSHHSHPVIAWAVVLHRLPVGLLIWWTLRPKHGWAFPTGLFAFLSLCTIGGYTMGGVLLDLESHDTIAWFQALVAGSLMHLALDQHDDHQHHECEHGHIDSELLGDHKH